MRVSSHFWLPLFPMVVDIKTHPASAVKINSVIIVLGILKVSKKIFSLIDGIKA